jgi:hypothetical protein
MSAPTRTGWLRPLAVAGLLAVAVLSGCSGDPDKPATLPSSSPITTSASPSPSVTPVEQQVEAAVRAYYAELTRAAQTNDTSTLRRMLDKNCPCFRAVRVIEGNARRGERTPDARFEIVQLKVHDIHGGTAAADTRSEDATYNVLNESGKVIDRIDGTTTHLDLSLVRGRTGQWIIANLFDLEGGG